MEVQHTAFHIKCGCLKKKKRMKERKKKEKNAVTFKWWQNITSRLDVETGCGSELRVKK